MQKRWMTAAALSAAALVTFGLLAGCGSSEYGSADYTEDTADYEYDWDSDYEQSGMSYSMAYDADYDTAYAAEDYDTADYDGDDYGTANTAETAVSASGNASAETEQKLIYTASVDAETTDFDKAVEDLAALTGELGGYYEYSSQGSYGDGCRYMMITVRIPAENYSDFLTRAGGLIHVLSSNEYTEDVSEEYYDVAGRLETQQTKLERLRELLEEAENMEDIIVIENEISETEEIIDSYTGQLRHYDALVDYSTVDISLEEVIEETPEPEPQEPTFGGRLLTALSGGIHGFLTGLQGILIVLAYIWPWLLLAAAIVFAIIKLRKHLRPRREARRARRLEKKAARAQRKASQTAQTQIPGEQKQ